MYIADFLSRCEIKAPGYRDPMMGNYIQTTEANETVLDKPSEVI